MNEIKNHKLIAVIKQLKVLMIFLVFNVITFTVMSQTESLSMILDMIHNNPGEAPYDSQYNDPNILKKMGYNGKVFSLFESAQLAVNWDKVDKNILPIGTFDRLWVDSIAACLDSVYTKTKKAGLQVFCHCDLILFPKRLIDKYNLKDIMGDPKNKQTEKYLRILLREMFAQFPQLDGIVVRIGETYLQDAPYHFGTINNKTNAEKTIIPLINILRDEVCVKLNKEVIFRTWYSFDVNDAVYMQIDKAIEPHSNLTISIKHCEGDFHRGNPFSKVLGIGRHKQLVEVQCAREYEGKGAYPNYIAKGVIDGFEEYASLKEAGKPSSIRDIFNAGKKTGKLNGIWTWTRGGGWEGPYIENELWCDLNAYVMAQWAKNPSATEESVFKHYTRNVLRLDNKDGELFRKLALMSTDAIIRGRRSVAYPKEVNPWWTRDEYIGFPRIPNDLKKMEVILAEKDTALVMWQEIIKLSGSICFKDEKTSDYVKVSSKYGLCLFRIYRSIFYLAAIDKNLYPRSELKEWIDEYDTAWLEYQLLAALNSNCPTLFSKDKALRMPFIPADNEVNRLRRSLVTKKTR